MKITTDRMVLRLLLLASVGALTIAFIAQFMFGLEPCILCKYQRIPYFAVILFAGLALHIKTADQAGTAKLIGLIFIISAALAFYHNGVEQHWWEAATSCGSTGGAPSSFQDFKNLLTAKMPKRCDQIDWTLFGLSMTVYNVAASCVLAGFRFFGASILKKICKGAA